MPYCAAVVAESSVTSQDLRSPTRQSLGSYPREGVRFSNAGLAGSLISQASAQGRKRRHRADSFYAIVTRTAKRAEGAIADMGDER